MAADYHKKWTAYHTEVRALAASSSSDEDDTALNIAKFSDDALEHGTCSTILSSELDISNSETDSDLAIWGSSINWLWLRCRHLWCGQSCPRSCQRDYSMMGSKEQDHTFFIEWMLDIVWNGKESRPTYPVACLPRAASYKDSKNTIWEGCLSYEWSKYVLMHWHWHDITKLDGFRSLLILVGACNNCGEIVEMMTASLLLVYNLLPKFLEFQKRELFLLASLQDCLAQVGRIYKPKDSPFHVERMSSTEHLEELENRLDGPDQRKILVGCWTIEHNKLSSLLLNELLF